MNEKEFENSILKELMTDSNYIKHVQKEIDFEKELSPILKKYGFDKEAGVSSELLSFLTLRHLLAIIESMRTMTDLIKSNKDNVVSN